ncbi:MAG: indolepyruvate ferredoxin oxidoreductase family protein [Actinomycetota bacterium]
MTYVVTRPYELRDRYHREAGRVVLTGIQALARLPIEQLRRDRAAGRSTAAFLSGYPGSPLGGYDAEVARAIRTAPDLAIVHQPAVNEELGATAVMGSQLATTRPDATVDGVVGIWYGKAPGLDRAGDALRHGVFAGASPTGGAVVLVGDDPACKSSTMPSSSDATLVDLHMPILYPSTIGECLELGLHAVAMSRATGLWSAMKIVTPIADGSGTVDLPVLTDEPVIPTVLVDGEPWQCSPTAQFLGPRMLEVEREFREIRLPLAHRYGVENALNRITSDPTDAWIGLVATGFTYAELLDALRRLGLSSTDDLERAGIRLLQLRMPVPFDADLVRHFARGLDEVMVVEEKNPTLEWLIKDALYGGPDQPRVVGKTDERGDPLMRSWGQLDADAMIDGLRARLTPRLGDRLTPPPPPPRPRIPLAEVRTPFFCSGCPHNWGTKVPDEALVGAGTGCHGMSLLMAPERVGEGIGITAMGNEGAQWVGMSPFVETDHLFQNYGDGTYFHSGQLALQYCIGAGLHMTFKILYNSTVAMTGGQDAPFALPVPELCRSLLGQGVTAVAVTTEDVDRYRSADLPPGVTVYDRTDIVDVQDRLRSQPGVTVLIHDQECAAELRRARRRNTVETPKTRVVINHRICEGCGDCGDVSNCLSVQPVDTPLGRKTTIDQASCNIDLSCLGGDCPAFMTVEISESSAAAGAPVATSSVDLLPAVPGPKVLVDGEARIRLAGIGGTGVVTAAQILATAAMFDGWTVRGVDQTGLSQKAGPVMSDLVLVADGATASNLVGTGEADVLLAFDGLVGASDASIRAVDPNHTMVIASSATTPTGRMVTNPAIGYPSAGIAERLSAGSRHNQHRFVDAAAMATALVGGAAAANVLLLGVAVQAGWVPVSVQAVEEAIDLNGVAVATNRAAFTWGRRLVHDPDTVAARIAAASATTPAAALEVLVDELQPDLAARVAAIVDSVGPSDDDRRPDDLHDTLTMLTADLVGYQSLAYATRFLDSVATAAEADTSVGADGALTETVARNLHKLMAYKDEYEVARLMLAPEAQAAAEGVAGEGATPTWHLHPPVLAAMGVGRKLRFGRWSTPGFAALKRGRRLRGTALDPFGRTELRRIERALPLEYETMLGRVYPILTAENLPAVIDLAALPDQVRGYEDLKLRRVADYRLAAAAAMADLGL